jgi:TonB family protein
MSRFYLLAVLLVSSAALAADPEPYFKSAPMPFYPPLAREARIEGKVTLRFTVNAQGDTSDVEAVTGHQMLKDSAIQNVQNWKFAWPQPCDCRAKREAVFIYGLTGELETESSPTVTVKWFSRHAVTRVEIKAGEHLWQP